MYSSQITRAVPTCVIFLLDQSGSMADPFGGDEHTRKADFVARVVNHALHDLVIRCTKTEEVRNYYYVSVIGYGRSVSSALTGALSDLPIAPISEVADHPARIGFAARTRSASSARVRGSRRNLPRRRASPIVAPPSPASSSGVARTRIGVGAVASATERPATRRTSSSATMVRSGSSGTVRWERAGVCYASFAVWHTNA